MSVLIVEDDSQLRKFLETLISRYGLATATLDSGDGALDAIRTGNHSAVILDLMLPGMTGFEIINHLYTADPHLLRRIIALTAVSQSTLHSTLPHRESIWDVIRKPFDIDQLMETVLECAVANAMTPSALLSGWLERRSVAIGAQAAVVVSTGSDHALTVTASFGFSPELLQRYFPLPCREKVPLCAAVREGHPFWLSPVPTSQFPRLLPMWKERKTEAIATAPMQRDGMVVGGIGWSFATPQPFDAEQRESMTRLAQECGAQAAVTA